MNIFQVWEWDFSQEENYSTVLLSVEPWAAAKKSFMLSFLSRFLSNGHLPRVSRQPSLSFDKGNKHESGACVQISFRLPYGWGKSQLWDVWRLCDQSSPQMGSLTSKWPVGPHSTSWRAKEGKQVCICSLRMRLRYPVFLYVVHRNFLHYRALTCKSLSTAEVKRK